MRRGLLLVAFAVLLITLAPAAGAGDSWTGEVLDLNCYQRNGAHGEGHAECATRCLKGGSPVGLLTEDGDVVLLVADDDNPAPYDELKSMAGKTVEVSGTASEEDGKTTVRVASAKEA